MTADPPPLELWPSAPASDAGRGGAPASLAGDMGAPRASVRDLRAIAAGIALPYTRHGIARPYVGHDGAAWRVYFAPDDRARDYSGPAFPRASDAVRLAALLDVTTPKED